MKIDSIWDKIENKKKKKKNLKQSLIQISPKNNGSVSIQLWNRL